MNGYGSVLDPINLVLLKKYFKKGNNSMSNISLTRLSYNNQVVGVRINLNHGQKLYDIGTTLEVVEKVLKSCDLN